MANEIDARLVELRTLSKVTIYFESSFIYEIQALEETNILSCFRMHETGESSFIRARVLKCL